MQIIQKKKQFGPFSQGTSRITAGFLVAHALQDGVQVP